MQSNLNYFFLQLARYNLHQELQEMENKILRNLQSVKRSILYDFDKKIQDLKRTVTLNTISVNDEQSMENFGYVLPIPDLANFLEFEEDLTNSPEKLQRLVNRLELHVSKFLFLKYGEKFRPIINFLHTSQFRIKKLPYLEI